MLCEFCHGIGLDISYKHFQNVLSKENSTCFWTTYCFYLNLHTLFINKNASRN